jgi:hypothetical protein
MDKVRNPSNSVKFLLLLSSTSSKTEEVVGVKQESGQFLAAADIFPEESIPDVYRIGDLMERRIDLDVMEVNYLLFQWWELVTLLMDLPDP